TDLRVVGPAILVAIANYLLLALRSLGLDRLTNLTLRHRQSCLLRLWTPSAFRYLLRCQRQHKPGRHTYKADGATATLALGENALIDESIPRAVVEYLGDGATFRLAELIS